MQPWTYVVAACLWLVAALSLANDGEWTVVDRERGITSSRREQPGCGLPSFRGEGHLHGGILQVLAVMLDASAVDRWAYGVDKSRLIKRIDRRTDLIYLYSDLPWPVRDRDMIVRREIDVLKSSREFLMRLTCEPDAEPERADAVRVKQCRSSFRLTKVEAETTELDYEMSLDPAGHLPKWVSGWVAKTVPFRTLVAVEERAAETHGEYEAVVRRWSAAM